jgi:quinol monooxygenase YgiN
MTPLREITTMTQRNDGYVILALLRAKAGQERDLAKLLDAVVRDSREEPGNRQFEFYVDQEDPSSFMLYEEFVDPAAVEAHRARASIGNHMGAMKPLLDSPPEVSLWTLTLTNAGMEAPISGAPGHVTLVRFRMKKAGAEPMLAAVESDFGQMKGNIRFDLNLGQEDPLEAMICARWSSRAAWQTHNARPEFSGFVERTKPWLEAPMRRRLWQPAGA